MSIATTPSMDDHEDRYTVTSRLEIQSLLRSVQRKNSLLRMHVKGRLVAIITTILEIDTATNSLIVDNSSDEEFNRRITTAGTVCFETYLDKIRIDFSTDEIHNCVQDGRPALRLAIPTTLTRVQRRDSYRVETPVTDMPRCTFTIDTADGPARTTLDVMDISAGGICVVDNMHRLDNAKGATYPECKLNLPEFGDVIATLRVTRSLDDVGANNKERRLLGCKFVSLSNPMQMQVHSCIDMVERKLNAKRRGFE
ncbi:MAG: flagellar brake protein [Candidimonas sp.]|nr:flagellar brake protein [Candidimonas sp.]